MEFMYKFEVWDNYDSLRVVQVRGTCVNNALISLIGSSEDQVLGVSLIGLQPVAK